MSKLYLEEEIKNETLIISHWLTSLLVCIIIITIINIIFVKLMSLVLLVKIVTNMKLQDIFFMFSYNIHILCSTPPSLYYWEQISEIKRYHHDKQISFFSDLLYYIHRHLVVFLFSCKKRASKELINRWHELSFRDLRHTIFGRLIFNFFVEDDHYVRDISYKRRNWKYKIIEVLITYSMVQYSIAGQ